MEFTLQKFQNSINNINNEKIRILLSIQNKDNNDITKYMKIDNNKLKLITNNLPINTSVFKRDMYYSQIRDDNIIYTEDYELLNIFAKNNFNISLTTYNITEQDIKSFPKLYKYHYSEQITKNVINMNNFDIITENDKIFIEINKNNLKNTDTIQIFDIISLLVN